MIFGERVQNSEAIGGTIVEVETWGPVVVKMPDGRTLEIRTEEGYDGAENATYVVTP